MNKKLNPFGKIWQVHASNNCNFHSRDFWILFRFQNPDTWMKEMKLSENMCDFHYNFSQQKLTEIDWIPNLCKSKGQKNNYWDLITFFIQFLGQTDIRTEEVLFYCNIFMILICLFFIKWSTFFTILD